VFGTVIVQMILYGGYSVGKFSTATHEVWGPEGALWEIYQPLLFVLESLQIILVLSGCYSAHSKS
jgi:hypothetical protein